MLIGILKKIGEFCSLKVTKDADRNKRKAGFTIIELMVVIIVINLLSGVAVPKLTDYIEKTRQRIDLMKLYYLRDALNRALYEGDVLDIDESQKCDGVANNKEKLSKWLASDSGVTLFIMELHNELEANFQAKNNNRFTDVQNMCGILSGGGFWADAFKDAGFGAIADILYARDHTVGGKIQSGATYAAYEVTVDKKKWWRTHPREPLFISRALNGDLSAPITAVKIGGQNRYKFKIRWNNKNEKSHTLEVFIQIAQGADYGKPFTTPQGVCFSTEPGLCK